MKRSILASITALAALAGVALAPAVGALPKASGSVKGPIKGSIAKTGGIMIRVSLPDSHPSVGTVVEVTQSRGSGQPKTFTTDKYGRVYLGGLEDDTYLVVAFNADFSDFAWQLIRVKAGRNTTVVLVPPRTPDASPAPS